MKISSYPDRTVIGIDVSKDKLDVWHHNQSLIVSNSKRELVNGINSLNGEGNGDRSDRGDENGDRLIRQRL